MLSEKGFPGEEECYVQSRYFAMYSDFNQLMHGASVGDFWGGANIVGLWRA